MTETPLKLCTKCGQAFPATSEYWHRNKSGLYGFTYKCKSCIADYGKQRYNRDKDRILKVARDWELRNPDKKNAAKNKRYAQNPEKFREKARIYRSENREHVRMLEKKRRDADPQRFRDKNNAFNARNRDKVNARARELRTNNPQHKERVRAWRINNPQKIKSYTYKRGKAVRGGNGTFSETEWMTALEYFDHKCAVCGNTVDFWRLLAPDHWVPVSLKGDNTKFNIVPLCHSKKGIPLGVPCCNNSKGAKLPEIWLTERYGKRKAKQILNRINVYFEWVKSQDKDNVA